MPAKIVAVFDADTVNPRFAFVVSGCDFENGERGLISRNEAQWVTAKPGEGGIFNMCSAIVASSDARRLVGKKFK